MDESLTLRLEFTPAEELSNTISAGVATLMSIAALVWMTVAVAGHGPLHVVSAVVFGTSLITLYLTSALNHGLRRGSAKDFFHNVDQAAIYFLIAGTYTPVTLIALHNRTGYIMCAVLWTLALLGSGRKLLAPNSYAVGVDKLSLASYVAMGWIVLLAPAQLIAAIPTVGLMWLIGGGVFYTVGVVFFRMTTLRFHHLIWHLFVIAGSTCHVIAIYGYVL